MTELLLNSLPEGKISFSVKRVCVFMLQNLKLDFVEVLWPIFSSLVFFLMILKIP